MARNSGPQTLLCRYAEMLLLIEAHSMNRSGVENYDVDNVSNVLYDSIFKYSEA